MFKRLAIAGVFGAIPQFAVAQSSDERWSGHMPMWDGAGYGLFFGPVMWILVLGLVVVGVVWAVRSLSPNGASSGPGPASSAIEMLRLRYARGEIDTAEFEERKRKLEA